ncbi:hypothetical protein L218DRAFT_85304 [Marasmius fiardii PR-910]|nr:hypothetical protein L218DRAFT_85304 [Marasmius fiardii PR-910]
MPPGPAYNWLCVLSSIADIASHAARYRGTQLGRRRLEAAGVGKRENHVRNQTEAEVPKSKRDSHPLKTGFEDVTVFCACPVVEAGY